MLPPGLLSVASLILKSHGGPTRETIYSTWPHISIQVMTRTQPTLVMKSQTIYCLVTHISRVSKCEILSRLFAARFGFSVCLCVTLATRLFKHCSENGLESKGIRNLSKNRSASTTEAGWSSCHHPVWFVSPSFSTLLEGNRALGGTFGNKTVSSYISLGHTTFYPNKQ